MSELSGSNRRNTLHTVVVLALCAVFFLLAMGVTLLGANLYRGTAAASDDNYQHRTSLSFLTNQIRRNDCGTITLVEFDGQSALMLFEWDGDAYATLLYSYNGQLRELYAEAEYLDGFRASDGIPVMELGELDMSLDGQLLTIVADGHQVTVAPRCNIEEVSAP